jgi:hypothetical protein
MESRYMMKYKRKNPFDGVIRPHKFNIENFDLISMGYKEVMIDIIRSCMRFLVMESITDSVRDSVEDFCYHIRINQDLAQIEKIYEEIYNT